MDVGYASLITASAYAAISILGFLVGNLKKIDKGIRFARYGVAGTCAFVSMAVFTLVYYLVTHNFQIQYVALHTDKSLPLLYTVSGLWAGSSGSLLLWAWLLSIFLVGVMVKERNDALTHYALSISLLVELFFLFLLLTISNPFIKLGFIPADGMGLNPLLRNPGMVFHPPTLFAGYSGLTIPFGFAMSGLLTSNERWVYRVRKWAVFSWLWLGLGVFFGANWAYVVLGWGGYWAWDPVENASLLPWLTSTAFLHSIMIEQARRGMKLWNILLSLITIEFVIFGTFITRSGIIGSVHAFAESPLGTYFMAFMMALLVSSLFVVVARHNQIGSRDIFESIISKEITFLLNNVLLVVSALSIWWGTIFPVIYEAVVGTKIRVGPVFYNQTQAPLIVLLLGLTGLCIAMPWRRGSIRELNRKLKYPLVIATLSTFAPFLLGYTNAYALAVVFSLVLAMAITIREFYVGYKESSKKFKARVPKKLIKVVLGRPRRYGGYIVHLSMLLIVLGVVWSSLFSETVTVSLERGQSINIGKYNLVFVGNSFQEREDKVVWSAKLQIYDGARYVKTLEPSIERYYKPSQLHGNAEILSTLTEDVYVILQNMDGADIASLEIRLIPLVNLIWIGGVVMVVGAGIALAPRLRDIPR